MAQKTFLENERFVVEEHSEQAVLYHITQSDCVPSIMNGGILPSDFGNIDVGVQGNEDGRGVYALDNDESNAARIEELSCGGEALSYVKFLSCGPWYKVVKDKEFENGFSAVNHVGYIVHPNRVPRANLLGKREI